MYCLFNNGKTCNSSVFVYFLFLSFRFYRLNALWLPDDVYIFISGWRSQMVFLLKNIVQNSTSIVVDVDWAEFIMQLSGQKDIDER